ncbi:MAG TPA: gas vesicle protein GvpG [Solirubrobacteraceae bacterium]|jgi:hypothetical protein|nr:gas vesicle protein GvpG [Solirubrobacteraceae bacterium]
MGLFTGLLTLPLAPVRGVAWVAEQVAAEAERELYDEDRIRAELLSVELEAEAGKLSEEERYRMEDALFTRLAAARELRTGHRREPAGWEANGG